MTADNNNQAEPPLPQTLVLLLLDGWGVAPTSEANAISLSKTPNFNYLIRNYPVTLLNIKRKSLNARYLSLGSGQHLIDENHKTNNNLTQVISTAGLRQIKIGETERLAALTYFFNGGREDKLVGEDWKIISSRGSSKNQLITNITRIRQELEIALETNSYSFLIVSIPSVDLIVRSEDAQKIIKTIETLDKSLEKIVETVLDHSATLLVSAACGNAENVKSMATELIDNDMTDNPVPLIIIGDNLKGKTFGLSEPLNNDLSLLEPLGGLDDLAPTILDMMNLPVPLEMTGQSLTKKANKQLD